jgi:hypothetical protein
MCSHPLLNKSAIAWMWAGEVPQHPPIIRAPAWKH